MNDQLAQLSDGDARRMRINPRVAAAFILVLAVVMLGLAAVGGLGMAACAAPPPGWHRVATLGDFIWLVPPLVVFLVGEYHALAARRVRVRVLYSALVVVATVGVAFFAVATLAFSCGQYAP